MFESQQKSSGTRYTLTVALVAMALIFSPAILMISRPVGYLPLGLAVAASAFCLAVAWLTWRKYSLLSIPSIVTSSIAAPGAKSK